LALVKGEKSGSGDLHGTGDVENVHGAATETRGFRVEQVEGPQQLAALDIRQITGKSTLDLLNSQAITEKHSI